MTSENPYEPPIVTEARITFSWQRVCRTILLIVGVLCTLVGILAIMKTAYDTQFANYFADGTAASPYTYAPIPVRIRRYLECCIPLSLGIGMLFSASRLRRTQVRQALIWLVAGPIAGVLIEMIGWALKASGY